jgi:FKBP-type peptidyl-prolyl cis-trans isomerase 2
MHGKMTGEENETVEKRDRDPIVWTCLVVLMIASVAVLGVYVNDNYISAGPSAANGNTVEVDFIGTLYGEYGADNAAVFDTSLWSVANNESILKTNDFTLKSESSYKLSSVTIGKKAYLSAFENAIIGMKVGETKNITISVGDGYYSDVSSYVTYNADSTFTCYMTENFPKESFESLYDTTITSTLDDLTSPYGWKASAVLNSTDNTVDVTYYATAGTEYVALDNTMGKVNTQVKSVSGGMITYSYEVERYTALSVSETGVTSIQQLEVKQGLKTLYIDEVTVSGNAVSSYEIKDISLSSSVTVSKEIYNEVLHFQITLKSIAKSTK